MKKTLLIVIISLFINQAHAMLIQLADEETLNARFSAASLGYFAEKTEITSKLAQQKVKPLDVVIAVEKALACYSEHMKDFSFMAQLIVNRKGEILALLLDEYQGALLEAEKIVLKRDRLSAIRVSHSHYSPY